MAENWRQVPDYPLYMVSSWGRVLSLRNNIILRPLGRGRYLSVALNRTKVSIHRLVLYAFVGPPSMGHVANHKNSDCHDNRLENLEWVTQKRNIEHATENGLRDHLKGVNNHKAKLTEEQVKEIRASGWTPENNPHKTISAPKLAKKYGISHQAILGILRGNFWKHI